MSDLMKLLGSVGLCCALVGVAHADATVELGDGVVVTAIDGKDLSLGLFSARKTRYVLPAGAHVLSVRFEKLYDLNADNHDVVKSGAVTLPAVQLADQQVYRVAVVNAPSSHSQAQHYARTPEFVVQDAQGQVVTQLKGQAVAQPSLLDGVSRVLGEVSNGVAGAVSGGGEMAPPTTMQHFKTLWQAATADERKAMLSYGRQHLND